MAIYVERIWSSFHLLYRYAVNEKLNSGAKALLKASRVAWLKPCPSENRSGRWHWCYASASICHFCLDGSMARDYQIEETETELLLHVPPPHSAWKVAVATVTASASLWYGGFSFYLWLARSESSFSFLYCIAYNVLFVLTLLALRVLYKQLAKKEVTFERHVIGIDYRILGVRVQRKWFSVHQIQEWVTVPKQDGRQLLLAIKHHDRLVTIVDTLNADLWLALVVRMQRKDFVYV